MSNSSFVTTLRMPVDVQAALDAIRDQRTRESGRRPPTRELVLEALAAYVAAQSSRAARGRRGERGRG